MAGGGRGAGGGGRPLRLRAAGQSPAPRGRPRRIVGHARSWPATSRAPCSWRTATPGSRARWASASAIRGRAPTNMVSGMLEADSACVPVVALSNGTVSRFDGAGALQELDVMTLMRPVTKWSSQLRDPAADAMAHAPRLPRRPQRAPGVGVRRGARRPRPARGRDRGLPSARPRLRSRPSSDAVEAARRAARPASRAPGRRGRLGRLVAPTPERRCARWREADRRRRADDARRPRLVPGGARARRSARWASTSRAPAARRGTTPTSCCRGRLAPGGASRPAPARASSRPARATRRSTPTRSPSRATSCPTSAWSATPRWRSRTVLAALRARGADASGRAAWRAELAARQGGGRRPTWSARGPTAAARCSAASSSARSSGSSGRGRSSRTRTAGTTSGRAARPTTGCRRAASRSRPASRP